MNIRWFHKISNIQVLQQSKLKSIKATLNLSQLRWAGHLVRMEDSRIPKQLFYGELSKGKRRIGRPKLRYKDSLKANMKETKIDVVVWEKQALERSKWRTTINKKVTESEETKSKNKKEQRAAAKARPPVASINTSIVCQTCNRVCASNFGLRAHMKIHK